MLQFINVRQTGKSSPEEPLQLCGSMSMNAWLNPIQTWDSTIGRAPQPIAFIVDKEICLSREQAQYLSLLMKIPTASMTAGLSLILASLPLGSTSRPHITIMQVDFRLLMDILKFASGEDGNLIYIHRCCHFVCRIA